MGLRHWIGIAGFGAMVFLLGCHPGEPKQTPSAGKEPDLPNSVEPLEQLNAAVERGDWATAWELHRDVLMNHPDDPDVFVKVAKVAFANNQMDQSADLLLDAVRLDAYENIDLVKQSIIALTSVGRVFDAMEVLESAVENDASLHELRRWLFDFQTSLEQHHLAVEHGRVLVRERQIDFALLLELSNTERRKIENDSTDQLAERNPQDKRYLAPKAKVLFDRGELDQAKSLALSITDSSPDFVPAQILLGRILVDLGELDQLPEWAGQLPANASSHWGYWMVLGDWARYLGQPNGAARAYWESIERNPDVVQVWAKFAAVAAQLSEGGNTGFPVDRIEKRANLLSALYAQKDRFERSNRRSKRVVHEIATTLMRLGRPWEAEAWAALGMTIVDPEKDPSATDSLKGVRSEILRRLSKSTPWQTIRDRPELVMDLNHLSLPSFEGGRSLATSPSSVDTTVSFQFADEAASRGLQHFGRTRDDLDREGVPIYAELGCGGGTIDYDLDGWQDLYLMDAGGTPPARDSRPNVLYRNLEGAFQSVTTSSGTVDRGFGQGVATGDVNADGFPDLFLLNYGVNALLINNGDGTFSRTAASFFGDSSGWSTSGAIADLNADGLPEIVSLQYCQGTRPVTEMCTNRETGVTKSCAPIHFPAARDQLLSITATGKLRDVTNAFGMTPEIPGRGLGVIVGDLDGANGLEIFVANDMTNNHLYARQSGEAFGLAESGMLRGLACDDRSNPQASMGIGVGDLDQDGDVDLYVTNFENEYNTFYENGGAGTWQDKTAQRGLARDSLPTLAFGTEAIDFDSDGNLELIVANGHVNVPVEKDDAPYAQPMHLFRRSTSARFELADVDTVQSPYFGELHVGRSLWTLDADRDGRVDVAVTHQTEPVALLINQTPHTNHWIAFQLRGTMTSRDAIGTRVEIRRQSQTWQQSLVSGDGFQCSNERVLRFGLGDSSANVDVTVRWPDGSRDQFEGLEIDREWLLVQDQEATDYVVANRPRGD